MTTILREVVAVSNKQKDVIVSREEIMRILPHRGRMLLLDEVVITDNKAEGKFLVTEEVCQGHAVFDSKLVLKGSDLFDMAAQLLGVWAAKNIDFPPKNRLIREYGRARFRKPIFPGEKLVIEIEIPKIKANILSNKGGWKTVHIIGEEFSVRVGDEAKARIFSVELVVQ